MARPRVFFLCLAGRPPGCLLFPTRRSSDLQTLGGGRPELIWPGFTARLGASPFPGAARKRSEEHTSELQSRSDLVCRLLLEKKNTPATTRPRSIHHRPRALTARLASTASPY